MKQELETPLIGIKTLLLLIVVAILLLVINFIFIFQGVNFESWVTSLISVAELILLTIIHFLPQRRLFAVYQLIEQPSFKSKFTFFSSWLLMNVVIVGTIIYSVFFNLRILFLVVFFDYLLIYLAFIYILFKLAPLSNQRSNPALILSQFSETSIIWWNFFIIGNTYGFLPFEGIQGFFFVICVIIALLPSSLNLYITEDMLDAWPDHLTAFIPFVSGKRFKQSNYRKKLLKEIQKRSPAN